MKALLVCRKCARYTMKSECPSCGAPTTSPHPARFSINDKYARYRWMLQKESERDGAHSA